MDIDTYIIIMNHSSLFYSFYFYFILDTVTFSSMTLSLLIATSYSLPTRPDHDNPKNLPDTLVAFNHTVYKLYQTEIHYHVFVVVIPTS